MKKEESHKDNTLGTAALILGILSIVFASAIGLILGIIGLVFAYKQTKKTADYWAKIGKILSIIGIIISIIAIIASIWLSKNPEILNQILSKYEIQ